jgi:hypothetical protein
MSIQLPNTTLERFLADILEKRDVTNVTRMHDTLELLIKYNNIPVNLSIKIISIYWKLSMEADFALPAKESEEELPVFEAPVALGLC